MKTSLGSTIARVDRTLSRLTQDLVPAGSKPVLTVITTIGTPAVTIGLLSGAAFEAFLFGGQRLSVTLALGAAAAFVPGLLKHAFHRSRPDTLYVSLYHPHGTSFPSGHSAGSVIAYGMMAVLGATYLPLGLGLLMVLVLAILTFLIGVSRIWLGAHYPTDVLGGWVIGGLLLWLVLTVGRL